MPVLIQLRTQDQGCNCLLAFVRVINSPKASKNYYWFGIPQHSV